MSRLVRVLLLLLPLPLAVANPAAAGELTLDPPTAPPGAVVTLRYTGPTPRLAVARFQDRLVYLSPGPDGAAGLLGAGLQTAPGRYPVRAVIVGADGEPSGYSTELEVIAMARSAERLTLPAAMVQPRAPAVLARIAREGKQLRKLFARQRPERWPLVFAPPVPDRVGSRFGLRRILNNLPRAPHSGVDFRSPAGRPVRAPAAGVVALAGDLYFTGQTVVLDHGEGLYSVFAHLRTLGCRVGQRLTQGQVVGEVGSTGRATGPHLHWTVRLRGNRVDPLTLPAGPGKTLDSLTGSRR